MSYAKIKSNQVLKFPYGFVDLKEENPYTNFNDTDLYQAFQGTTANISGEELVSVSTEDKSEYDQKTQKIILDTVPQFKNSQWVLSWSIVNLSEDEIETVRATKESEVRVIRNKKLADSDWTQLADSPLTNEEKSAWQQYRHNLRNISQQTEFPWNVNWPLSPIAENSPVSFGA